MQLVSVRYLDFHELSQTRCQCVFFISACSRCLKPHAVKLFFSLRAFRNFHNSNARVKYSTYFLVLDLQ